MLTDVPGSTAYFKQGWVTYSNEAKKSLLFVKGDIPEHLRGREPGGGRRDGVQWLDKARADFTLAISGVAGPDGGTPEKPVGTVWIALGRPSPLIPA